MVKKKCSCHDKHINCKVTGPLTVIGEFESLSSAIIGGSLDVSKNLNVEGNVTLGETKINGNLNVTGLINSDQTKFTETVKIQNLLISNISGYVPPVPPLSPVPPVSVNRSIINDKDTYGYSPPVPSVSVNKLIIKDKDESGYAPTDAILSFIIDEKNENWLCIKLSITCANVINNKKYITSVDYKIFKVTDLVLVHSLSTFNFTNNNEGYDIKVPIVETDPENIYKIDIKVKSKEGFYYTIGLNQETLKGDPIDPFFI